MKSRIFSIAILISMLIGTSAIKAQQQTLDKPHYDTPDLVIGLIVDQMRPDFIYKYWDQYEEGGIKRLVNEGHTFRNAYFRHLQTSTGPGHAA